MTHSPAPLQVAVVDLIAPRFVRHVFGRFTYPSLASIMPQAIAVWARDQGHAVTFVPFTGREDLRAAIPTDTQVVFIASYTEGAYLAYALSAFYRSQGAVTVLGGPHAQSYRRDAEQYFDYVVGHAGEALIARILEDPRPQPERAVWLCDGRAPDHLPGIRERWPFAEQIAAKGMFQRFVPILGSLGCPYTCSFCNDARTKYQPRELEALQDDLVFLQQQPRPPGVMWHDPNFGVRFHKTMDAIEEVMPPGALTFIGQSTLSLMKSEDNLKRFARNGFRALAPGIESWTDYNMKSRQRHRGEEKVDEVAEQVQMICRYIPYLVCNFVFGIDSDEGDEPFALTRRFIDRAPGVYPKFCLITAFGHNAPLAEELHREGRVLDLPFSHLNNYGAFNVRLKNYDRVDFYDRVIALAEYAFSRARVGSRFWSNTSRAAAAVMAFRSIFGEWRGLGVRKRIRDGLVHDPEMRAFFAGETPRPPTIFVDEIRAGLGPWWTHLPERVRHGLLHGDPTPNTRVFATGSADAA